MLKIQLEAIKSIKKDIEGSKVVNIVKKSLGKYDKNFVHGLGHGLGVYIHELPNLKEDSKDKLKKGTVFTIEPGIYFDGKFGIRIEDTVYLKDKPIVLTKISKKMVMIK